MKNALKFLAAALVAASVSIFGALGASAQFAAPPTVAPGTVIVHTAHAQQGPVTLKVGQNLAFAQDGQRNGSMSNPVVTLDSPGSMQEVDLTNLRSIDRRTMSQLGDEERVWKGFQGTQPGTFTVTVIHSAKIGVAPQSETVTINVVR